MALGLARGVDLRGKGIKRRPKHWSRRATLSGATTAECDPLRAEPCYMCPAVMRHASPTDALLSLARSPEKTLLFSVQVPHLTRHSAQAEGVRERRAPRVGWKITTPARTECRPWCGSTCAYLRLCAASGAPRTCRCCVTAHVHTFGRSFEPRAHPTRGISCVGGGAGAP